MHFPLLYFIKGRVWCITVVLLGPKGFADPTIDTQDKECHQDNENSQTGKRGDNDRGIETPINVTVPNSHGNGPIKTYFNPLGKEDQVGVILPVGRVANDFGRE